MSITIDELGTWTNSNLGFNIDDPGFQTWVETNVRNIQLTLQDHDLLRAIQTFIASNQAGSHKKAINIVGKELDILTKGFKAIKSKIYRINVLENPSFPSSPPPSGWIDATNLYAGINDLIRSTIICRHLDEPRKIATELATIGHDVGVEVRVKSQAKERGYYAYHVYFKIPVHLVDRTWKSFPEKADFEVQITTQMQYMLYELTHVFYDKERDVATEDRESWKWDYRSPRFTASYLSHTLHFLEGMIVSLYEDLESRGDVPELIPSGPL